MMEIRMWKFVTTMLAAAFLLSGTSLAFAQSSAPAIPAPQPSGNAQGENSAMSDAQMRQQLEGQGYTVQSLKHERNYVEANVRRGSQTAQLRVDPQNGAVSQAPAEDDDNDQD
jgi:Spy/CpxP family protein refolding chaperone